MLSNLEEGPVKSTAFRKITRRTVKAEKRSQLVENNEAKPFENFQNWLLRTGASPQASLPASQIGLYTDFN